MVGRRKILKEKIPGAVGAKAGRGTGEFKLEIGLVIDKLFGGSRVEAGLKHRNRSQLRYLPGRSKRVRRGYGPSLGLGYDGPR
jgi:hypothetical protein